MNFKRRVELSGLKKRLRRNQHKLKHYEKALNARNHVQRTLSKHQNEEHSFCSAADADIPKSKMLAAKSTCSSLLKNVTFKEGSPEIIYVTPPENVNTTNLNFHQGAALKADCSFRDAFVVCEDNSFSAYTYEISDISSEQQCNSPSVKNCSFFGAVNSPIKSKNHLTRNETRNNEEICACYYSFSQLEEDIIASDITLYDDAIHLVLVTDVGVCLYEVSIDKFKSIKPLLLQRISLQGGAAAEEQSKPLTNSSVIYYSSFNKEKFVVLLSPCYIKELLTIGLVHFTTDAPKVSWIDISDIVVCSDCLITVYHNAAWKCIIYIESCMSIFCSNTSGGTYCINYDIFYSQKNKSWRIVADAHKIHVQDIVALHSLQFVDQKESRSDDTYFLLQNSLNKINIWDSTFQNRVLDLHNLFEDGEGTLIWAAYIKDLFFMLLKTESQVVGVAVNPVKNAFNHFCKWNIPPKIILDWQNTSQHRVILHSSHFIICYKEILLCLPFL